MTRFKFFGFLLPLAIAGGLALGLMSVPVGAHHCKGNHPTEPPCGDPNPDTDEIALLTLGPTGAMSTTNPNLVVRVSQNSAKRLQFQIPFDSLGPPGIQVHLDIQNNPTNCGIDPEFPGVEGVGPTKDQLLDELESTDIQNGSLIVRIDKKKLEAEFVIEYLVTGMNDPLEGRIRIFFFDFGRDNDPAKVVGGTVDFPGTFAITGSIAIWWEDVPDLQGSIILVCDNQVVDVELTEIP